MSADSETGKRCSGRGPKRLGGRSARRAMRAAPLSEDKIIVIPGMESGRYEPLSKTDVEQIRQAAFQLLEELGLAQATPEVIEYVSAVGGIYGDDKRLRLPRKLVEDTITMAARHFVLHGQDPKHDMQPWGKRVYFSTAGAAVSIVDAVTKKYREPLAADLYDSARLVDRMDNIHMFQRTMIVGDAKDMYEFDINTMYSCISGTSKHVGTSFGIAEHVEKALEMLHMVAGSEEAWRARPFVSMSNCHVVPPMRFAEDSLNCLVTGVKGGMPILLLSAGQAGATAPAALAGAVVQAVAECLAGLVVVNAIKPGAPAIMGTWPFVSDLRTGAMSGGSGEQALLTAACGQVIHSFDLTVGSPAGMTDAKIPDAQAGYEKGYTEALAAMAGVNIIYECAGMHASLLGHSLDSIVIDNDMLGAILRNVYGIDVNAESMSIAAIKDVCINGPQHYLGHEQTLGLMEKEYLYPDISDRNSPKVWVEYGSPSILDHAIKRKEKILGEHYPSHISDQTDAALREKFPILIGREDMKPGNKRWPAVEGE